MLDSLNHSLASHTQRFNASAAVMTSWGATAEGFSFRGPLKLGGLVSEARPRSLGLCLSQFLAPDPLAGSEAWHCPKCDQKRDSTQVLRLVRPPPVLVLQLKRFSYVRARTTGSHAIARWPDQ